MKKNLLLDVDGVLANFYAGFGSYLNRVYGTELNLNKEPEHYNFDKWNEKCVGIDLDEASHDWILQDGFKKMPAYDGAKSFVDELNKISNIYVVTARIGDFKQKFGNEVIDKIKNDTISWFKENKIPANQIYFEHKKVDFCKNNNIYTLIEDKLETALKASKDGIDAILINRGWNQHPNRHRVYRANNYNDILNIVRKINNE